MLSASLNKTFLSLFTIFFTALYGCLFTGNTEAAFANYRLWESLGFLLTYAYNDYLCADVKLYICIGFLVTGVFCYFIVEVIEKRRTLSKDKAIETVKI